MLEPLGDEDLGDICGHWVCILEGDCRTLVLFSLSASWHKQFGHHLFPIIATWCPPQRPKAKRLSNLGRSAPECSDKKATSTSTLRFKFIFLLNHLGKRWVSMNPQVTWLANAAGVLNPGSLLCGYVQGREKREKGRGPAEGSLLMEGDSSYWEWVSLPPCGKQPLHWLPRSSLLVFMAWWNPLSLSVAASLLTTGTQQKEWDDISHIKPLKRLWLPFRDLFSWLLLCERALWRAEW
jgi:hypothetical protein